MCQWLLLVLVVPSSMENEGLNDACMHVIAYEVLSDENTKKHYDLMLAAGVIDYDPQWRADAKSQQNRSNFKFRVSTYSLYSLGYIYRR
jgi:hypothetical protein